MKGNLPGLFGDVGVPPGDTLTMDLDGADDAADAGLGDEPGDGTFVSNGAPLRQPVYFHSIETVTATAPYHLLLDMAVAGFAGGPQPDDILLQRNAVGRASWRS